MITKKNLVSNAHGTPEDQYIVNITVPYISLNIHNIER
jgi:hypothetical protein